MVGSFSYGERGRAVRYWRHIFSWKAPVAVILISILALTGKAYYEWVNLVIPEEMLPQAIERTISVDTYHYQVALQLQISGENRLLSHVRGKRQPDQFHLQGEIAGQEVDVIYVNNRVYMKDAISGRWMVNHGGDIFQQDLFMIEVNPIASLKYESLTNINYLGIERGRIDAYVIEYTPVVTNQMLTTYWQDFRYKVWIDRRSKKIFKLEVFADHRDASHNGLHMQLLLYGFNERFDIQAPSIQ